MKWWQYMLCCLPIRQRQASITTSPAPVALKPSPIVLHPAPNPDALEQIAVTELTRAKLRAPSASSPSLHSSNQPELPVSSVKISDSCLKSYHYFPIDFYPNTILKEHALTLLRHKMFVLRRQGIHHGISQWAKRAWENRKEILESTNVKLTLVQMMMHINASFSEYDFQQSDFSYSMCQAPLLFNEHRFHMQKSNMKHTPNQIHQLYINSTPGKVPDSLARTWYFFSPLHKQYPIKYRLYISFKPEYIIVLLNSFSQHIQNRGESYKFKITSPWKLSTFRDSMVVYCQTYQQATALANYIEQTCPEALLPEHNTEVVFDVGVSIKGALGVAPSPKETIGHKFKYYRSGLSWHSFCREVTLSTLVFHAQNNEDLHIYDEKSFTELFATAMLIFNIDPVTLHVME